MDRLEKAERLREHANVSYEEAKAALDQTDGDLLEAMVLLEKQGKTKQPEQETYSTRYEEQKEYVRVQEKVEEQKQSAPTFGKSIGTVIRLTVRLLTRSRFLITRKAATVFSMPAWVAALIVLFFWKVLVPLMIVGLFFGFRYSFEGLEEDTQAANDLLNKAGSFADEVESELHTEKE